MRRLTVIPRSAYTSYPWKNGKGTSLRIAGDNAEPFQWRISLSKIEASGPFSPYPKYRRFLVPLSDGPLRLRHNQKRWIEVSRLGVHAFRGEWETEAECQAPVEDFNVIISESAGDASAFTISIANGEQTWFPTNGQRHYLYCHRGQVEYYDPEEAIGASLHVGDTLEVLHEKKKELRPIQTRGTAAGPTEVVWVTLRLS